MVLSQAVTVCLIVVSLFAGAQTPEPFDGIHPIVVEINPSAPAPGSVVQVKVTMDGVATSNETVAISTDNSSVFASLPSSVFVSSGSSTVQFNATLTSSASGGFTITAAANGTGVQSPEVAISDTER